MTVVAGTEQEDAKGHCPRVGQVWLAYLTKDIFALICFLCGSCLDPTLSAPEISYLQITGLFQINCVLLLIEILFLTLGAKTMIRTWRGLSELTTIRRNGQWLHMPTSRRLTNVKMLSVSELRLNRGENQYRLGRNVRMHTRKFRPGQASEICSSREQYLVIGTWSRRLGIPAKCLPTLRLVLTALVVFFLQNSCGTAGAGFGDTTPQELPHEAVSGVRLSILTMQTRASKRKLELRKIAVTPHRQCHDVLQNSFQGCNVAHCERLSSSAPHKVCEGRNVGQYLGGLIPPILCYTKSHNKPYEFMKSPSTCSTSRAAASSNRGSYTVGEPTGPMRARDSEESHSRKPLIPHAACMQGGESRSDRIIGSSTDECWLRSSANSSRPWGWRGKLARWEPHQVSAHCAPDHMCNTELGLINPSKLMLMKTTDDRRATTPLLAGHRAREPDPEHPARDAHEDDSQWNYWYQERPPPEPPLFEVDPVEEAAREKRHIAALMKARPGTTEEYWRAVTKQTVVPPENLAHWRSPKLIELGRRESIRRSDNFAAAPTAAAAEPSRSVQDPTGMPAGRPERKNYQLQLSASDEERQTEPTQSQAIEPSTMQHPANTGSTERVEHHHNSTPAVGAHGLDDPHRRGGGNATATTRKLSVEPESGCEADHVVSKGAPLPRHARQCPPAPREQHGRLRAREEGEVGAAWSVHPRSEAHHAPATTASLDHRYARGEGRPAGEHPSRFQAKKRTEPSSMTAPQAKHQHVTIRRAGQNQRWLDRAETTRSSIEASWATDATVPTRRLWTEGPDRSRHKAVNEASSDAPVGSNTTVHRRAAHGNMPIHAANATPSHHAGTEEHPQVDTHEMQHQEYIHYRPPRSDEPGNTRERAMPASSFASDDHGPKPETWSRSTSQKEHRSSEGARHGARLYAEAYQSERRGSQHRQDDDLKEANRFADAHASAFEEATLRAEARHRRATAAARDMHTDRGERENRYPEPSYPRPSTPTQTPPRSQRNRQHGEHPYAEDSIIPDEGPNRGRVYLYVVYEHIGEAKRLGARYDPNRKRWYAPNAEPHLLQRWGTQTWAQERQYINVPFCDNDEARSMGAKWDREARQWYDPTDDGSLTRIWGPAPARKVRPRDEPETRRYIRVSYNHKNRAKALGARWDPQAKSWYMPYGLPISNVRQLTQQFPETRKPAQRMMQRILETPPMPKAVNPKTHSPTPLSPGDTVREGVQWGVSSICSARNATTPLSGRPMALG